MAEIQRNKKEGSDMLNDRDIELEEFKGMRIGVDDMLSNSCFDTGIIEHEDRVLLQKLLRDITDVIQILETMPQESDISSRYLSERKADTRGRYRQVKELFDDKRRLPVTYMEGYMSNSATFQQRDLSKLEHGSSSKTYNTDTPKWEINRGYDDDEEYNECYETNGNSVSNEVSVINNQRHGNESDKIEGASLQRSNRLRGLQQTSYQNRENISYIGDAKYFVDDEEETRMLTVVGDDNWTLLNPNLSQSFTVFTKNNTNIGHSNDKQCEQALSTDKLSYSSNDIYKRSTLIQNGATENLSDRNTISNNHRHDNDDIDYDVGVTINGTASEEFEDREDDIKHVLKGFDYLDEMENESNSEPVISRTVTEDSGIREDDIKHALRGFDYLDEINENNDGAVNDALSGFNYLDQLDEVKDDGIKNALEKFDYLDDIDEDKSTKSSTGSEKHNKDGSPFSENPRKMNDSYQELLVSEKRSYENGLRHESKDKTFVSAPNVSKRIFDEDKLEFKKLSGKDFAKAAFDSKNEGEKSVYLYQGEYDVYGQKKSNARATAARILPEIYRSNPYYNKDDKYAGLVERTRSQEIVSSFTAGEFILRKARSEDINHPHAAGHKEPPDLETLTEERFSTFTDNESVEYAGKGSFRSSSCNVCSLIIKALLVLLFGLAAAKITLGVVFRDTCQVEEIVPICVIASGSLSICFCFVFFGIYFLRKRFGKLSRSFRIFFVFIWVIILGVIIAGCVLLYPSIEDYAFRECSGQGNCCSRKLTLTAFGAIIIDLICQLCFFIILCSAK